ncbi:acyl carrier protein [Streptomyces pactum]|uniref:Acyl carrier protein n=1 Tax=Streptomyces pactum TaxID=68249 RepID=A0ABS0NHP7_9ACTN|nr:acyl carrier protein [Streptomyces pactum]MBH5334681.1 acyl carrier protein [Streptomyces pactum]
MSSTYDRLVTLLTNGFGIEPGEVSPETTFEELDLDSLALVELTLAAQDEFGIQLADDDLHAANTLAQTVEVLDSKLVTL